MKSPPDPVLVGRIVRPHGLRGEVVIAPVGDIFDTITVGQELWAGVTVGILKVEGVRSSGGRWLTRFAAVTERDAADRLRGVEIYVDKVELADLREGTFFVHDLIGCQVETVDGVLVGQVDRVVEGGAQDLLEVRGSRGIGFIPLVRDWTDIRLLDRRIILDPPAGLLVAIGLGDDP